MNRDLIHALFDNGILQLGRFHTANDVPEPIRLDLALLPSYPGVAGLLAERCAAHVQPEGDLRLCCALELMSVGILVSDRLCIPLVYTPQREQESPTAFIGAYDIGHPTILLWSAQWKPPVGGWSAQMEHVGLHRGHTLYVVGDEGSVISAAELLETLAASRRLTSHAANLAGLWIEERLR